MHRIDPTARVAFQGEPGAFSEIAARKLLGARIRTVACPTFESLFSSIDEGRADLILAPLENTLAGPVLRCYDLLYQSASSEEPLTMIGEVVLRISHCVIGCPGATLEGLRRVQSHPVALARCERFFAAHPGIAKAVAEDTAGSVTRFALLQPQSAVKASSNSDADATTLVLTVTNQPGALFRSLEPFAANSVDLMSLVSRPLVGTPWHYRFFFEVAAAASDPRMTRVLDELKNRTVELRVLGSYRSGK